MNRRENGAARAQAKLGAGSRRRNLIANALMRGRDGTSGVDWNKAVEIGYALLFSPIVGFFCAAGLLLIMKFLIRKPELYAEPKVAVAPPLWIRGLTSAGVSFAHGSNDGQKAWG